MLTARQDDRQAKLLSYQVGRRRAAEKLRWTAQLESQLSILLHTSKWRLYLLPQILGLLRLLPSACRSPQSSSRAFKLISPAFSVWMPTRIHPTARVLADELFDVITPEDPRAAIWPDLAVGAIVRCVLQQRRRRAEGIKLTRSLTCSTGQVTEEEIKRAKYLQIITRNGALLTIGAGEAAR